MKIRPTLTAIALLAASAPAAAMPQCYAIYGGRMVDLSYMCGSGSTARPVSTSPAPVGSPQTYTPVAAEATEAPLPQLVDYRLNGDTLEIELRNPGVGPTRETSVYYQIGYWVNDDYRIADGYVDVGGETGSSEYIRLNVRREHAEIDSAMDQGIPIQTGQVNVLTSHYNR